MRIYSPAEKEAYYFEITSRWENNKALAEADAQAKALYEQAKQQGVKVSYWSFYFTLTEMRAANLAGLPYLDCKTLNHWRRDGFRVRLGERSRVRGIVWRHPLRQEVNAQSGEMEEVEDRANGYPKVYHLFHRSQVEPITE
jgi:hypothetical protein